VYMRSGAGSVVTWTLVSMVSGQVCDDRQCTSVGNDCCAPLQLGEEATCTEGYVPIRLDSPCYDFGRGAYKCCEIPTSCDDRRCSSIGDDCCAPFAFNEQATCHDDFTPFRTGEKCMDGADAPDEGRYHCCSADPPTAGLSSRQCKAMLRDSRSLFRRMWAAQAWGKMADGRADCWNVKRDNRWEHLETEQFFADTWSGRHCGTNWYEGNDGELGLPGRPPHFDHDAPALFGFDESIDDFCLRHGGHEWEVHGQRCVTAGINILSLYGDRVPYNICRNLEWQVCAAKGWLPGQNSMTILFARAPSSLDPAGSTGKPLGEMKGWVPPQVPEGGYGYATDDIFYLEVCMMDMICSNGFDLWTLKVGDRFVCLLSPAGMRELQTLLLNMPYNKTLGYG